MYFEVRKGRRMPLKGEPMNSTSGAKQGLRIATIAYLAGFVVHNADHARRGVDASPEPVVWAGTAVAMLTAVIATLVFTSHRLAPRFSAAAAASIAVGVAITHLTPSESTLTDPLTVTGISPLSWIAVLAEIITAALLATVALRTARHSLELATATR
jgi:hypothetical protein